MKRFFSILVLISLTGCSTTIYTTTYTFHFDTEDMKRRNCSILSVLDFACTITHIDGVPTNLQEYDPYSYGYTGFNPPIKPDRRTNLILVPGNHDLKYSYTYVKYFRTSSIIPGFTPPSNGKEFNKKGMIKFSFKEGEHYSLNIVDTTSSFLGKSMSWMTDWNSKLNSCISISIK